MDRWGRGRGQRGPGRPGRRGHPAGTIRTLAKDPRATATEAQLASGFRNVDLAVALRDLEAAGEPRAAPAAGTQGRLRPRPALQVPTPPSRTQSPPAPAWLPVRL